MKLNTPSERFFLFMAITMMFAYGYQHYFNYRTDRLINNEIEAHNVIIVKHNNRATKLQKENSELKRDIAHTKSENESLIEQIDHVAGYYQIQVIKLKDEIIDLKYKDKK
jgi:predicted RNase H-like nuclease (RuvC/YqgF family)